jgi:predicted nucleic acid-binding protein
MALMWRYQIKSYDAFHAATALEYGIRSLATLDADFQRVEELDVQILRNG